MTGLTQCFKSPCTTNSVSASMISYMARLIMVCLLVHSTLLQSRLETHLFDRYFLQSKRWRRSYAITVALSFIDTLAVFFWIFLCSAVCAFIPKFITKTAVINLKLSQRFSCSNWLPLSTRGRYGEQYVVISVARPVGPLSMFIMPWLSCRILTTTLIHHVVLSDSWLMSLRWSEISEGKWEKSCCHV